jgi:UDP:flavonoid glycosyltransferase YjiC (YdhE family)
MLILCPDWFAMPQKDWPSRSRTVGFVYHDAPYDDAELASFIDRVGRPLVFTPGTGVTDVDAFFSRAAAVCGKLGLPGVFLSPSAEGRQYSPDIAVRGFAELHWLLPRTRMLIHHGGIGSTAQAIRAGVPQIVLPGRFDQPDNALRTAILGLGGAVMSRASTDELAALVSQVLADGTVRCQVTAAARLIRKQDALDRATDLILQVAGRHFDGASQWRISA